MFGEGATQPRPLFGSYIYITKHTWVTDDINGGSPFDAHGTSCRTVRTGRFGPCSAGPFSVRGPEVLRPCALVLQLKTIAKVNKRSDTRVRIPSRVVRQDRFLSLVRRLWTEPE